MSSVELRLKKFEKKKSGEIPSANTGSMGVKMPTVNLGGEEPELPTVNSEVAGRLGKVKSVTANIDLAASKKESQEIKSSVGKVKEANKSLQERTRLLKRLQRARED